MTNGIVKNSRKYDRMIAYQRTQNIFGAGKGYTLSTAVNGGSASYTYDWIRNGYPIGVNASEITVFKEDIYSCEINTTPAEIRVYDLIL